MLKALALCAAALLACAAAPAPLTSWYWQLSGVVGTNHPATLYDIDAEGASAALVATLHADGHTVICYIDAGGWEPYRADADLFPASVIGRKESGWNEYYLDIRSPTVRSLMADRMDAAKAKGCDGIEPDVMDTYTSRTGFTITKANQIDYAKWWATTAHGKGMIVALKNDAELVTTLVPFFDFSIAEECFKYAECQSYAPFVAAGKAVLLAEYSTYSDAKCAKAKARRQTLVFYNLNLDGKKYQPCP